VAGADGVAGPVGAGALPGAPGQGTGAGTFTAEPGTATLSGTVCANGNGDTGLAGRTVFLDRNGNGLRDAGEPSAVTDSTGNYVLSGVEPGTYTLRVEPLPGEVPTSPTRGMYPVSVAPDANVTGEDFWTLTANPAVAGVTVTPAPLLAAPAATPSLAPATVATPDLVDLTGTLRVVRGRVKKLRGGRLGMKVTLVNGGNTSIQGPLQLVLQNLTRKVQLWNRTGLSGQVGGAGNPYLVAGNGLAPGASMTVVLLFRNPTGRPVQFVPRVVAGTGTP
jgi:hypothetical protein